ncbi:MAG: hypothetical protein QGF09_08205, partial [Rhodospirillales bacterium]|nr:hypothetical protein [Rhodospirillales bacterium]
MDQFTHGSFFWGDGAVAAVITAPGDRGLHYCAYAEANAGADWGAMRLDHGDGVPFAECAPARDLKIIVDFPDIRAQADYISGEKDRCGSVIRALLEANELGEEDIAALFLPSIGKNRVPILLEDFPGLREKLGTDFRYAHMGGVDVMYFVHKHLAAGPPAQDEYYIALTPAFTAQWGGVLLNYQA